MERLQESQPHSIKLKDQESRVAWETRHLKTHDKFDMSETCMVRIYKCLFSTLLK